MSAPAQLAPSLEAHHIPYTITVKTLNGIEFRFDALENNTIKDIMLAVFRYKNGPNALGWGKKEQHLVYRKFKEIEFDESDTIPKATDSMQLLEIRSNNGKIVAVYYKDFFLKELDPSVSIFCALEVLANKKINANDHLFFRLYHRLPDLIEKIDNAHRDLFGNAQFKSNQQRIIFDMMEKQRNELLKEYRKKFDFENEMGFKEFEEKVAAHIDDLGDFSNLFPKESRKPSKSEVKR
jgi:hypothetical protein